MGNLLAGAAMKSITPTVETLLALKAAGMGRFEGIAEELMFRCIAISDGKKKAVFAAYDLGDAPFCFKLRETLKEKYDIEPNNIIFAATHNHEGMEIELAEGSDYKFRDRHTNMLRPRSEEGIKILHEYSAWVFNVVVETIGKAIDNMKPARMGYIVGKSYINASRDLPTPIGPIQANNFHAPSDHDLMVVRFDDLEGNTIGMFVNHATHSNFLNWNLGEHPQLWTDIGGGVSRFVENANKKQFPVLWAIGAAGDQSPIVRSGWRIMNVDEDGNFSMSQHTFQHDDCVLQMKCLTSTQGMEVLSLSESIDNFTEECRFDGTDTYRKIPGRKSYVQLGLYGDLQKLSNNEKQETKNDVKSSIRSGERPEPVPLGEDINMHFTLFRLNDIAFAGINCEAYSNLGLLIKRLVPAKATAVCTLMDSGSMGYIMDAETEQINGFGTCQSNAWSGELVDEAFTDGYTELSKQLF